MATLIKSASQLQKILETKAQQAILLSQNEIYEVIQKHIQNYYSEYTPRVYVRTDRFLNSLIKTDISIHGNSFSCSVKFDDDYWDYNYFGGATGAGVVISASEGLHGGFNVGGEPFWDNAMEELGGRAGIMKIIEKNFKKVGLPLTK